MPYDEKAYLVSKEQAEAMQQAQDEYDQKIYRLKFGYNTDREDAESLVRQDDIRQALQQRSDELRYAYPPKDPKNSLVVNDPILNVYKTPYGEFQAKDLPWKPVDRKEALGKLDQAAMGEEAYEKYMAQKSQEKIPPEEIEDLGRLPTRNRLEILLDWLASKLK